MQLLGDLRVRVAVGDQSHHLLLALGQRDAVGRVLLPGRHQRPEARVQVVAARDGDAKRLQELGRIGLLEHVAARARTERLARVLGVLTHREDRDRERRMSDEAGGQRGEARAARHRQVECEQIGLVLADFADRGGDVRGFGHDFHITRLLDDFS